MTWAAETDLRVHRVVAEQPFPPLPAMISRPHLYGFPLPDSDYDVRGPQVFLLEAVEDSRHVAVTP